MPDSIYFGVGCFHFSLTRKPPFTMSDEQYLQLVKKALEALPNVTKVQLDAFLGTEPHSYENPPPPIDETDDFTPLPYLSKISFEVQLPPRLQAELLKTEERRLSSFTTRFKTTILYGSETPVAFVEPVAPSEEPNLNMEAIEVVAKFLERDFPRSSRDLRFEWLARSPYHAEFYLLPAQGPINADFEASSRVEELIPTVAFTYNVTVFKTIFDARDQLYFRLAIEFSLFYYVLQKHVVKSNDWERIEKKAENLIALYGSRGPINYLKRLFVTAGKLDEIFIALSRYEMGVLRGTSDIDERYRETYAAAEQRYLRPFIDNEIKNDFIAPVSQLSQLMQLFEVRRSKRVDAFIVLVAALLGGIVGSLATYILTRVSGH